VTSQDSPIPDRALDESAVTDRPRVAVIGTGTMGEAMAANLVRAGLATTVWDRSPGGLDPLVVLGAVAAETAAEAAGASDFVITMLATGDAVVDTAENGGLVEAIPPGGIWFRWEPSVSPSPITSPVWSGLGARTSCSSTPPSRGRRHRRRLASC
jgi:predicted NAD/FAD-dependent oxidoreductase